jgi:hypothetical protein
MKFLATTATTATAAAAAMVAVVSVITVSSMPLTAQESGDIYSTLVCDKREAPELCSYKIGLANSIAANAISDGNLARARKQLQNMEHYWSRYRQGSIQKEEYYRRWIKGMISKARKPGRS